MVGTQAVSAPTMAAAALVTLATAAGYALTTAG
jgi:hypothetical protein